MRGKREKVPATACFANLEKAVVDLRDERVPWSWRPGQRLFIDHRPKGREVTAPFRYRIVHHALARVFGE